VLDKSGSMSGQKIQKAREAAIEAVRRLGKNDMFSLVAYDNQVRTLIPAQKVRNIDGVEQKINSISTGGNTALFGGVSQGANEIRKSLDKEYVNRIILLSDGLANVGPQSPSELGRLGTSLIKEGISVTTIGIGNDYNEDLMTQLSGKSDGNTYFVESSSDLPHIFGAELGDVLNVVARKVIITIECPKGVKPKRIIGREGRVFADKVEIGLNQLYGGQEKYALVEVEIDPQAADLNMEIATTTVRYDDAITQKSDVKNYSCPVSFSPDEKVVQESQNGDVQVEYFRNIAAENRDKVIECVEAGNTSEAIAVLKYNEQLLIEAGNNWGAPELIEDAKEQNFQWNTLQTQGLTKDNRKRLRTDSYDDRNQQATKSRAYRK
jgi:Ca-activated chloride channel family protein